MPRDVFEQKTDPEGAPLRAPHPRDTGRTMVFVGRLLLFTSLVTLMFVGWDVRGGGLLVQVAFGVQAIAGVTLLILGHVRRRSVTRQSP